MSAARNETKTLIARQISLIEGRSWNQLSSAVKIQYLTHAENILATVERKMTDFVWRDGSTKDRALGS